jgi:long-chain acyl-CoA synthetase
MMNRIVLEQLLRNKSQQLVIDSHAEKIYTYDDVYRKSVGIANFLFDQGVRQGSMVGIILNNCIEFVTIYIANLLLGAISIPLNPNFNYYDYDFILEKCQPDVILTTTEKMEQLNTSDLINRYRFLILEKLRFAELDAAKLSFVLPDVQWDDTIAVLYTSGTTGKPKGVIMKFGAVFENFKQFGINLGFNQHTRFMQVVPMFHAHGWLYSTIVPILFGASFVLNEPFGVRLCLSFWEIVRKYGANVMVGVPSMLTSLLQLKDRYEGMPRGMLEYMVCGSAFLHVNLKKSFETTFGTSIYEFYGSTETLYIAYHHPGITYREGAVGKVFSAGCQVRVAEDGELFVKTKYLFKGYLAEDELTSAVLNDGWYQTGDLGRIDHEGYIYLTGRKKDLINKGGFKVSPKEITDALLRHEAIIDAATIGVPDRMYGEEIYSFVHLRDADAIREADLYQYCKEVLNPIICPRRIVVLRAIPKNSVGKVDKFKLREIVEQKYRKDDDELLNHNENAC